MHPRPFAYAAPTTIDEAVALAARPGAKVLAGGMSLLPLMKLRLLAPELVVDLGRIDGLDAIDVDDTTVRIGARVIHRRVAEHPLLRWEATALAEAAALTGDVQVRNRGTLAGSLAHADVAADQPAAAIALGASVDVVGPAGRRRIPVEDLIVDALTTSLAPGEIVVAVEIPRGRWTASAYDKLGRRGGRSDYAVAGAAAAVRMDGDIVAECRVAVTGVSTHPRLVAEAGDAAVGDPADAGARAAATVAEAVPIIGDLYGDADYKRHLATVYVHRVVDAAVARAREGG